MKKTYSLFRDARLLGYNACCLLFSPYFLVLKLLRLRSKGLSEVDPQRWFCPLTNEPQTAKSGAHVVFISTGFGDMRSGQQLSHDLLAARPETRITWAVKYRENMAAALAEYPDQPITFVPFDFLFSVWNWLRHLDPDVVIFVNQKWSPNIAWGARLWGASVLVVNGRIKGTAPFSRAVTSKKSWLEKQRRRINFRLFQWTLKAFEVVCLQSEQELEKVTEVVTDTMDVRVTGAIKTAEVVQDSQGLKSWLETRGNVPLLAAGSVYEGEDAFVLRAFEIAREHTPCALMIAPRLLETTAHIEDLAAQKQLKVSLRSNPELEKVCADVYLLDTMGELANAYQFAVAAYVGGTLHGEGHNVIEPISWGIPVLFGSGSRDSKSLQITCEQAGVGFKVKTPEELAARWIKILDDAELRDKIKAQCEVVVLEQRASRERNLGVILEVTDRIDEAKKLVKQ